MREATLLRETAAMGNFDVNETEDSLEQPLEGPDRWTARTMLPGAPPEKGCHPPQGISV